MKMEQKHKNLFLLAILWSLVGISIGVYEQFLKDKPLIEAQARQNLSAQQAMQGIHDFMNTVQSNTQNMPNFTQSKP